MRCVALAAELERHRMEPWFASRSSTDLIEVSRYPLIGIEGPPEAESSEIRRQAGPEAGRRAFAALAMDHYELGAGWLESARTLSTRRLVIDDLADRRLPCEWLVNPNLGVGPDAYAHRVRAGTTMLLGTRYVLMRAAFAKERAVLQRATGLVGRVLVTFGGSDPSGVTGIAVAAARLAVPKARIDVVLGALYRGSRRFGPGVAVHEAVGEQAMARLMAEADLSIGAGGTSAWERCALGLPTLILRIAPNQTDVVRRLDEAGAAIDAGPADGMDVDSLRRLVGKVARDQAGRRRMSERASQLVDGRGSERVAHHLDGVRVRRATMADAELLWGWANDPDVRSASFSQEAIPYDTHLEWLRSRLTDRSCLLLIGENGSGPLGQVRFDGRERETEISITVAAEHRGTVGGLLLRSALRRARGRLAQPRLIAHVKPHNDPSRHLFERAGFRLVGEHRGVLLYDSMAPMRRADEVGVTSGA